MAASEEDRLLREMERLASELVNANRALANPTKSALLQEQQERVAAVDRARAAYDRAYAEWKALRKQKREESL